MIRAALLLAIVALLLVAPGDTVGDAPTDGETARQPTAEVQPASPEAVDDLPAAPAKEPSILSWAYWQQGGGASRSEIFRNFGLLAAALIGLGFGIWRAWTAYLQAKAANEQARIAEQGLFTDRFSTAVEHLGNKELPVRLGGIYALWRLARDSPKQDLLSVVDILCAFVRDTLGGTTGPAESATAEPGQATGEDASSTETVRPDVQTILDLLGDRESEYRRHLPPDYRLNLDGANLTGANLRGADLVGADLRRALLLNADLVDASFSGRGKLSDANLSDLDLAKAALVDAGLTDASLSWPSLSGASLSWRTNLSGANLSGASLKRANLSGANLSNANLSNANLLGAILKHANLKRAKFTRADLTAADLTRVDLRGADLTGADLDDAQLTGANLTGADLTGANFEGARDIPDLPMACADPDNPPKGLPEDVKRPDPWEPCPERSEGSS